MGLCKCPKRKVTNLFCFEHKVNVCEHCLVNDHVRCIIKSYLQWLQDSDFETSCCICQDTLEAGEVVRLLCYDVLHVSCAEKFLLAYPTHTAPDGFFCPACHGTFFPPEMVASPVADQLRNALEGMVDLQKRLQGLSAIAPDHSKSTPPSDRRPEPEGKEGIGDAVVDSTQTCESVTTDSSPGHAAPDGSLLLADEDCVLRKIPSGKDPESDSSSASDFIATHSGSHPRGAEDEPTSSPAQSNIVDNILEPRSNHLVSNANLEIPSSTSGYLATAGTASFPEPPSTSFSDPACSNNEDSVLASSFAVKDSAHVVVDVVEEASRSPIESVSIAMNEPPTAEVTSGRVRGVVAADESWSLTDSNPRSTSSASSSGANPSNTSVAFLSDSSSTLQRLTATMEPEYSTPLPKLPFTDAHHQYGANVRSSASFSSMGARASHSYDSFPRSEDHDDHKYRRKPIMEVVRTWLKIFSPPRGRRSSTSRWRRFVIILLIAALSLIGMVLLFHHMGRSGREDDYDPLLDPKANPFLKTDDREPKANHLVKVEDS